MPQVVKVKSLSIIHRFPDMRGWNWPILFNLQFGHTAKCSKYVLCCRSSISFSSGTVSVRLLLILQLFAVNLIKFPKRSDIVFNSLKIQLNRVENLQCLPVKLSYTNIDISSNITGIECRRSEFEITEIFWSSIPTPWSRRLVFNLIWESPCHNSHSHLLHFIFR